MFEFSKHTAGKSKIYLTRGLLPQYVEANQLPTKRRPFSTIEDQHFSHSIQLLLPETIYENIWPEIEKKLGPSEYSRVTMSLAALLEGEFFNVYIKSGNISMLSEGRPGMDNFYYLREGTLRLELPKEVYERAGLVGKPIQDGGRKHVKARYLIEINLRQPSMVSGKKGFKRIQWAFKNVLNESVTWLFHDHNAAGTLQTGSVPITNHYPSNKLVAPEFHRQENVLLPALEKLSATVPVDEEDAMGILEWLGLVSLKSPRIGFNDAIDPFLSRYQIPWQEDAETGNVLNICWHGFLPSQWVRNLFVELLSATKSDTRAWFALSGKAFQTKVHSPYDGYTMLCLSSYVDPRGRAPESPRHPEYVMWEMNSTMNML